MRGMLEQIVTLALGNVVTTAVEVKRKTIGGVIATLFFLTAYVALVMALAFYVAAQAGPVAAALVVAAAAMAAALVVLAVVAVLNRRTEQRMLERQAALAAQQPDPVTAGLMSELPGMMKASPIVTTIMVASFVYVLTRSRGFGRGPRV
ncbi:MULTISPECIES: hypothetical protein [Alphaproteobacteria]|uniref:Holin-X, holin superfamily III n=2 Tax=Alphaproteobacteria TaxID=28211 RepID=A0A512HL82_9HYPH|nr:MULTISPECIES: hypothetical protein [Alphaproteobacteria]GEO86206.1 hypothetical protein RNA01_31380 [Ciceribacter naphthalenivorans]GLR21416.1 hypothetical protein GCM10007920_12020 [Ciceribacter naphthalenivorans]GLT04272.1 hypothetical protein GCM10007926_12020 [Sphingomonas psychrolutea]